MQKLKKLFTNRWFWRFLGAILLGLLIWFVGPMIAIAEWRPFGWWPVTLFFALLPLLLVTIFALLAWRREKKKNAEMMEELRPEPADIEKDEIAAKLSEALDQLRTAKLGSRQAYVYQLPWYAIIGPSGAGKTTALLNCGLEFPTAVAGEYRALRGQPNTPNCDWWFTSEAVLIDTAGRYVSQDEDKDQDAAGWKNFLGLLQKYRPLQPLNGLIVAIPAPDFMDARKMEEHTRNVRERLAETTNLLGQNLPIYLMVTKADLLPGFREFFARATDEESDQVFGATAPKANPDNESVLEGFDGLVNSISSRVVDRMQNEADLQRRASIAGFPAQLASLRGPIGALLGELTRKTRFDQPARVRGVYFSSGTQTGNPVDRILMNVGAAASTSQHAVGSGRSYFLRRFFADLLVPEHGIASRNPAAEARAKRNYAIGIGALAATFVIAVGVWSWGYFRNAALIDRVYAITSDYSTVAGESRGGSATVQQDLGALGVLGSGTTEMTEASDFALGLGQGGRLAGEMRGIYGRDLQRRLMPILMSLAEERMGQTNEPGAVYDALKSYLILGGEGPEQSEHVMAWVPRAWMARGSGSESQAGDLATHTAALFDIGLTPQGIDQSRKENARRILRAQPPAVRVYGRLKSEALATGQRQWTARENAGPRPELLFAQSGAFAPSAGIPALFTRNGYDTIFLPIVERGPELLEDEVWVVGDSASEELTPGQIAQLRNDLERLYFNDFLDHWNTYLGLIELRDVNGLEDNVQRLRDAGGPLSPIAPLLRSIAEATDLTPAQPEAEGGNAGVAGEVAVDMATMRSSSANRAVNIGERFDGDGGGGGGPALAGGRQAIIQAFLPLRQFVGPPEGGGAMDGVLGSFTQVANSLNSVAVLGAGDGSTGAQQSMDARAAILQLRQNGNSLPLPAASWALSMAQDAEHSLGIARGAQMGAAVDANFANCEQTLATAFPIQSASTADLSIESFTALFGPNGTFSSFVNTQLNNYIDTTQPDWQMTGNAAEIGLTEGSVRAFQAANRVTRTFFAGDPTTPRLSYQIKPMGLNGADSVTLEIDGQTLSYDGATPIPVTFNWPGAGGATLQFDSDDSSVPSTRSFSGPWALFRMMKLAAVRSGPSPQIGAGSLTQSGARFDFEIQAFGANNPFTSDPFVQVACPDIDPSALALGMPTGHLDG